MLVRLQAEAVSSFMAWTRRDSSTGQARRRLHADGAVRRCAGTVSTSRPRKGGAGALFADGEAELELVQSYASGDWGASGDRTAARPGRRPAGPGLVAARHTGLPRESRNGIWRTGAGSAAEGDQPGAGGRDRPRLKRVGRRRLGGLGPDAASRRPRGRGGLDAPTQREVALHRAMTTGSVELARAAAIMLVQLNSGGMERLRRPGAGGPRPGSSRWRQPGLLRAAKRRLHLLQQLQKRREQLQVEDPNPPAH